MGVTKIVQSDARQARALHQLLERVGHQVGMGRSAVWCCEYVRVVADGIVRVFVATSFPPLPENVEGPLVEVDATSGGPGLAA